METNIMIILFMVITLSALVIAFWDDFAMFMWGRSEMNLSVEEMDKLAEIWERGMDELRKDMQKILKRIDK